jgi:hypothetical protein
VQHQLSSAFSKKKISALKKRWLSACESELKLVFKRRLTGIERLQRRVAFLKLLAGHIQEEVANAKKALGYFG